jgi:hypothetical protein
LVDNQINDLRGCQGLENKSSQKPTKTDTFLYYDKALAWEAIINAIGFKQPGSIEREDAFSDIELPTPKAEGRDLLIEVKAVSVNPVDTKMRKGAEPSLRNQPSPDAWQVLG